MAKCGVRYQYAEWARQRTLTTQEKYILGPTNTYLPEKTYLSDIVPLFIDQVPDDFGYMPVDRILFRRLVLGRIIETNMDLGNNTGAKHIYVKDSAGTRSRLNELASLSTHKDRCIYVGTHIVTITCAEAWQTLVLRIQKIEKRLSMIGWETMFVRNRMDLAPLLRIGSLLDAGKLPLGLVKLAVRLATARLLDFMKNQHPSGGMYQGKPLTFMYRTAIGITHVNGQRRQMIYVTPATRIGLPYFSIETPARRNSRKSL